MTVCPVKEKNNNSDWDDELCNAIKILYFYKYCTFYTSCQQQQNNNNNNNNNCTEKEGFYL